MFYQKWQNGQTPVWPLYRQEGYSSLNIHMKIHSLFFGGKDNVSENANILLRLKELK